MQDLSEELAVPVKHAWTVILKVLAAVPKSSAAAQKMMMAVAHGKPSVVKNKCLLFVVCLCLLYALHVYSIFQLLLFCNYFIMKITLF